MEPELPRRRSHHYARRVWPDAREWFLRHAGLGWSLAILLAITTAVLGQAVYHQNRSSTQLAALNDSRLLAEWLGEWKQNSEITNYFRDNFLVFSIPQRVVVDIDEHVRSWQGDRRQLRDTALRAKFSSVQNAATEFAEATEEMFDDRGGRYELPKEWRDGGEAAQVARYDTAHKAIAESGDLLFASLNDLFAAMHDRGQQT